MRVFWNDCGREVPSDRAEPVDLQQARSIWVREVRGVEGNFLGLIDAENRTLQFYFDSSIPDSVDDARHLAILLMDFPQLDLRGSYVRRVTIDEVDGLIETAFREGLDFRHFGALAFEPW